MNEEALLYAGIWGVGIDIAKYMLKRYGKEKLIKMFKISDHSK